MQEKQAQGQLPDETPGEATDAAPPATAASNARRERFLQGQVIAAQVARARAAGGQPSESEAARLVAEFHARGGQVTVLPEVDASQPAEGRGAPGKAANG
jgi:hypothetical protein